MVIGSVCSHTTFLICPPWPYVLLSYSVQLIISANQCTCRKPTLAKCGGEAQHLEKLEVRSLPGLPNVQSSIARGKTPCIGVFLVSLERSQSVDV